jgi:hypothetical protein
LAGGFVGEERKRKKLFSIGFGVDWLRDIVKEKQTKNRMESGGSLIFFLGKGRTTIRRVS